MAWKSCDWQNPNSQTAARAKKLKDTLRMLEKVKQVMSESWKQDLVKKVSQHFLELH